MRRNITLHRQWMVRSYAVALVFFEGRFINGITGLDNNPALVEAVIWGVPGDVGLDGRPGKSMERTESHAMKSRSVAAAMVLLIVATVSGQQPAERWWSHVTFLANDSMKGRDTGSPEHRKAAEYIARSLQACRPAARRHEGLLPARAVPQPRASSRRSRASRWFAAARPSRSSSATRRRSRCASSRPPSVEAPLVFAGYGLQVPESKHDDLAGLDLKGKIVVLLTGGPSSIPGPLLAHYQNTRWEYLKKAGALGTLSIQNPKGQDIPWDRSKLSRFMPAVAIADPALDETLGPAGRHHDQPRPRREALHRLRSHVQGAAGAVERRQGPAALPAAGDRRASRSRSTRRRSNPTT